MAAQFLPDSYQLQNANVESSECVQRMCQLNWRMKMHPQIRSLAVWLYCAVAFPAALCAATASSPSQTYDIVVAGAGTGGVSAAIEAARMGAHVALLEETDWIGGQMSAAAVSTMDEGKNLTPPSGIYREFLGRMEAYYRARGKSVGTCYSSDTSHCFEPSAIRKILNEMIVEVNSGAKPGNKGHIDLRLEERVVRVLSNGNTVTGVVTNRGAMLKSKVLIDATEFGDVLPLTPARYRSGRVIGPDRTHTCTQDITYTMVIRKYPHGVPKELQMLHPPPEYDKWLPKLRSELRIDGNPNSRTIPASFAIHNAYRGLPDSANPANYVSTDSRQITRTVLNWFNDFSVNTDIYDRRARKQILCEAKLKALADLYYIQHELQQPDWSIANDEGYDTAFNRRENACPNIPEEFKAIERNFPPLPYVRESQRLIGEYTLTGGDIRRERQRGMSVIGFPDAIAVGDYPDDLHGCSDPGDFEIELEHFTDLPPEARSGPFEVPLRSLIPEKVDGLLAAEKNISQSRLANGATRLQPITMLTGQAAGALAALAIAEDVQPRMVAEQRVQVALLQAGSVLAREPMPDLALGSRPWQAAQFAVTHQWMTAEPGGFAPANGVTRAQAAVILAQAFALAPPPQAKLWRAIVQLDKWPKPAQSSYADVPLYLDYSAAVEAWHARGLVPPCSSAPALFCPGAPLTVGEFIQSVAALSTEKQDGPSLGRNVLGRDVLGKDVSGRDDDPLTRADAALILYNSLR
jgi:hypothetical protein